MPVNVFRGGMRLIWRGSGFHGAGFPCHGLTGIILSFLQVLLHPNSGAAGKVGEIEALRLAQYKAFYTTGTVALPEAMKPGKSLLEFLDSCRCS